jgi:alpha-L-rhamnosidase
MWGGTIGGTGALNIAFELYVAHGDKRPLAIAYDMGQKWVDFLIRHTDDDGLLKDYDGERGYFLGEWLLPLHLQEFGNDDKSVFFNNCAFAMALDFHIRTGEIIGKGNEVGQYRERLDKLRRKIHEKYYNPSVNSYIDGDQVRTSFALFTGIVPDELKSSAVNHLINDMTGEHPYFNIGSGGRYPYYNVLFQYPQFTNIINTILSKRTWPGYGYFIDKGETTWPETWEIYEDKNSSFIHTGNTGISAWFIKSLAGISPVAEDPAYHSIKLTPRVPSNLDYARAGLETPYGLVESSWRKDNGNIIFNFSIPVGTHADVILPNKDSHKLSSGKHSYTIKAME